jgi:ABC-2 type transport system ATP-binding protein
VTPPNEVVIAAERLTKSYGRSRGIVDLSFHVNPSEVFGFLGPNGAGKTTTIRTMLDLIRPTSGKLSIFGLDPRRQGASVHRRIGYLPGELALYEQLTGEELLRTFLSFRGMRDLSHARELAERLGLDLMRRMRTLSHGNKQKIGLVQAFMHRPDLLILDEPTQGLDPLVQQEFYGLVEESRERGATVFLSSHVMPEVERVCDRVAIIREGALVTVADIGELKAQARRRVELHFERKADASAFAGLPGVHDLEAHGESLSFSIAGPIDAVVKTAARFTVVSMTAHDPSLEDVFLEFYGKDGDAP